MLGAIAAASISKIADFNPQDLANTAWAFATLQIKDEGLLGAIAAASISKIADFNPQDLANTAWAFATAGHSPPPQREIRNSSFRGFRVLDLEILNFEVWVKDS